MMGKKKNLKIVVSIPSIAEKLFDSEVSKEKVVPVPDDNPDIEKINQEARAEYHKEHPTISEFLGIDKIKK